ncbi:hypothetical protein GH714_004900 [Hevea brasiliensis]|uniref:RNase H type-1 domain-containing protein n=1 Tax=Hevea brasiliensis TaxID=3981 RepID=A0A6A6L8X8_HEVBR|nr:hypothetical protein GH714_004900 [Hevea brasiliensis]
MHLFFECPKIPWLWYVIPLRWQPPFVPSDEILIASLQLVFHEKEPEFQQLFAILTWSIWQECNSISFNDVVYDEALVLHRAMRLWTDLVGMVVRDEFGSVMMAAYKRLSVDWDVSLAEDRAVKFGLQLPMDAGFTNLEIKCDSKVTMEALRGGRQVSTYHAACILDIDSALHSKFLYDPWEANSQGHHLNFQLSIVFKFE